MDPFLNADVTIQISDVAIRSYANYDLWLYVDSELNSLECFELSATFTMKTSTELRLMIISLVLLTIHYTFAFDVGLKWLFKDSMECKYFIECYWIDRYFINSAVDKTAAKNMYPWRTWCL